MYKAFSFYYKFVLIQFLFISVFLGLITSIRDNKDKMGAWDTVQQKVCTPKAFSRMYQVDMKNYIFDSMLS